MASQSVKAGLIAGFAAGKQLPRKDIAYILPGSVYYGFLASTGTYWAVAGFMLTPAAPFQAQAGMQDGGRIGIFTHQGGQAWKLIGLAGEPFPHAGQLPAAIMSVWAMKYWGIC